MILSLWGLTPSLKVIKISIFLDTRLFFEYFLKKCFLPLERLKLKFAKNEVKAVKVAEMATPCGVSAALQGMSAALHGL